MIRFVTAMAFALFLGAFGLATSALAQGRELSLADILIALRSKKAVIDEKNRILAEAVRERGITFSLTPEIEKELGTTGARPELISAIRERNPKPKKDPLAEVAATLAEPQSVQPEVKIPVAEVKPAPPPPDFAFYRGRATKALNENDLDSALKELDKAAELKPGDATILYDRGFIYLAREQNQAALEQFSRAIEADPKRLLSFFNRGIVRERLGLSDDALADYEKAAEIDPKDEPSKNAVERLRKAKADAAAAEAAKAEAAKVAAEKVKIPMVVSVGPLNSYATRLALPLYPPLEKRMGTQGTVIVLVSLDETGTVTSAKAVDGPKQLRAAAEYAVKASKFRPVERDGKKVAASGSISFKFTL